MAVTGQSIPMSMDSCGENETEVMPYDDPNRPEWRGKRTSKNFARINAACKGNKTGDGKPPAECPKCGTSHKFKVCPVCHCPRAAK